MACASASIHEADMSCEMAPLDEADEDGAEDEMGSNSEDDDDTEVVEEEEEDDDD